MKKLNKEITCAGPLEVESSKNAGRLLSFSPSLDPGGCIIVDCCKDGGSIKGGRPETCSLGGGPGGGGGNDCKPMFDVTGLGGNGGGGGRGKESGGAEPSAEPMLADSGKGGGGGGGGTAKGTSSGSMFEDDATPLVEASDRGALGPMYSDKKFSETSTPRKFLLSCKIEVEVNLPIDDLNIGGFPGGGAPVGFSVGW